jgi:peptidyl-prolyl cis-trans isomerase D
MVHLMRKYQQSLLLVVTVIVIISFVWLYNGQRNVGDSKADRVGVVYGRPVTIAQFSREARKFEICRALGLGELWMTLIGADARDENQAVENYVWNSFVLRHEAAAMGIEPNDEEVVAVVEQIPAFQTNGAYDSAKYREFLQRLASRGFTEQQIEELVRDDLRAKKLKRLVGATLGAAPSEVRSIFEKRNQKIEASVIRFKQADFEAKTEPSEEDLKKLYEERKETLKSDEKRRVRFAAFLLEKTEKPLEPKARFDALAKLGDQAQEFALALTEKDAKFEDVAKKFGATPGETPEFTALTPPAEMGNSREAATAAFGKLTLEQPNSDVISTPNGYYVMQLSAVAESKPLTFEEAKASLASQLKEDRTKEALSLKTSETRLKLQAALKSGKTFEDAAKESGVQPEKIPAFSPMEPPKPDLADGRLILGQTFEMNDGQLSSPVDTATGALIIYLEKRLPVDEQKFEGEKKMLAENISRGKRDAAFELWLKDRRSVARRENSRG